MAQYQYYYSIQILVLKLLHLALCIPVQDNVETDNILSEFAWLLARRLQIKIEGKLPYTGWGDLFMFSVFSQRGRFKSLPPSPLHLFNTPLTYLKISSACFTIVAEFTWRFWETPIYTKGFREDLKRKGFWWNA